MRKWPCNKVLAFVLYLFLVTWLISQKEPHVVTPDISREPRRAMYDSYCKSISNLLGVISTGPAL